jgi:uncharacterized protein YndB with AHSA1/START domain
MKGIHRDIVYPHPPERVWSALTDPRVMPLWLMDVEGFEPRVGCRFTFRTRPAPGFDGIIHCEVVAADTGQRLAYTWRSGTGRPTMVTWVLHAEGQGTRLVLDHDGFRGVGGFMLRAMLGRGWGHKLSDYVPLLLDRLANLRGDVREMDRTGLLECDVPRETARQ